MAATSQRTSEAPPWLALKFMVLACGVLAGIGVLLMAALTTLDVIMRQCGYPLRGVYDMTCILGGVTLAFALPLTTALKGHVAIEYFFHKLRRRGRAIVDALMRLLQITAFVIAAFECWRHGCKLKNSGEVTATLQWPIFWVAWVLAIAAMLTALVTLYQLLQPKRKMLHL